MSQTTSTTSNTPVETDSTLVEEAVPRWGGATPAMVTVGIWAVSLATWWFLADPDWGLPGASLEAVGALLFWAILAFIFTGFTFANWPFNRMQQPAAGVAQVAFNVAFAFAAVWLFSFGIGSWDPTFAHDAAGGAGFTAAAFVVLIGFYAYALAAASWGGYPFEKLSQPTAGVAQFFMAAFITLIGVVTLIYPNFSAALAADAPISLPTALGWVYCSIVVLLMAAMLWENWPWAMIENRHLRALGAVVVSLAGGFVLFTLFKEVVTAIVPARIENLATFSAGSEAAQIGVCFSLWALTWGLVWGARPHGLGTVLNRLARTGIVTVLAFGTYILFNNFFATTVLHFPAIDGDYGGSPLVWMDWLILVLLWYTVAFGSFGSTRKVVRR